MPRRSPCQPATVGVFHLVRSLKSAAEGAGLEGPYQPPHRVHNDGGVGLQDVVVETRHVVPGRVLCVARRFAERAVGTVVEVE